MEPPTGESKVRKPSTSRTVTAATSRWLAVINVPDGFDESRAFPAVVAAHPGGLLPLRFVALHSAKKTDQGEGRIILRQPVLDAQFLGTKKIP
jgi:hypothetical protein